MGEKDLKKFFQFGRQYLKCPFIIFEIRLGIVTHGVVMGDVMALIL